MEVFNINYCCFITVVGVSWPRVPRFPPLPSLLHN